MLIHHVQKLDRSLRKRSLRHAFEKANAGLPSDTLRLIDGTEIKVRPEARHDFEYFCFRDPEVAAEYRAFVRHAESCLSLLDIGAAEGFFSLAFARSRIDRTCCAVEPNPDTVPALRQHLELNALGHRVFVAPQALNDKQTGDALCATYGFEPDCIKIDVDGDEIKVLRGLQKTMKRLRPIIFLEIHPKEIAERGDDIREIPSLLEGYSGPALNFTKVKRTVWLPQ